MYVSITSVLSLLATFYFIFRVIKFLPLSPFCKKVAVVIYFIFSQSFLITRILAALELDSHFPDLFFHTLYIGMAICVMLAVVATMRDVLLLLFFVAKRSPLNKFLPKNPFKKGHFPAFNVRSTSIAVCVVGLMLGVYGVYNSFREPIVKEVKIVDQNLPKNLNGFKIALLSDLHVGMRFEPEWLQSVVNITNNQKPDLIALAGDLLDGNAMKMQREIGPIADLTAPYGVFIIPGNHEYYFNYGAWLEYIKRFTKFTLLLNSGKVLNINGATLGIAGITDSSADLIGEEKPNTPEAYNSIKNSDYKVLLAHRPKKAKAASRHDFNLQLSGHTHGGQFFPSTIFVHINEKYVNGLYKVKNMFLYVSPGSGRWMRLPLRLGTRAEVTILTLSQR